jgi:hypothetical protein
MLIKSRNPIIRDDPVSELTGIDLRQVDPGEIIANLTVNETTGRPSPCK